MTDYAGLIKSAVLKQTENTALARSSIYQQFRGALHSHLQNLAPPWPEAAIIREQQSLEEAIRRVEDEYRVAPAPAEPGPVPTPFVPPSAPSHSPVTPGQAGRSKAKVVAPKYDYDLVETPDSLTYGIRTRSRGGIAVAYLIGLPLIIFAWFAIPTGLFFTDSRSWAVLGFGALLLAFAVFKAGYAKTSRPVEFDREFITVNGKKYLLSHVSHIGFSGGNQAGFIAPGLTGSAMMLGAGIAEQAGYYVYIVYGSQQIPIITGLDSSNVQIVYQTVTGFLARFGHNYG